MADRHSGRVEYNEKQIVLLLYARLHPHPDHHVFGSQAFHPTHHPRSFIEINQHYIVGLGRWPRTHHGHRIDSTGTRCLDPLKVVSPGTGLYNSRVEVVTATGLTALDHELTPLEEVLIISIGMYVCHVLLPTWSYATRAKTYIGGRRF